MRLGIQQKYAFIEGYRAIIFTPARPARSIVAFDRAFVRAGEAGSGVLVNVVEIDTLVALTAQEISKRYWRLGSRERAYVLR